MSDKILLSHGGGGEEMNALIDGLIFKIFKNDLLNSATDAAILPKFGRNLAFTTDSFVVTPRFFNGGNIGKIAVCGTINDLAMSGARASYISCALIIEEGFSIDELEIILKSMRETADLAGVKIVCGDTKVVPVGKCDGIFINTSGIGEIYDGANVNAKRLQSGQKIVLSGDIGRHGAVILAARDEIALESELMSDCAPLCAQVDALIEAKIYPTAMRDTTRGGLSAVLNEWAKLCGAQICIDEDEILVQKEVQDVCELLGFEPFDLANEGTFIACVDESDAKKCIEILQKINKNARIIGEICDKSSNPSVILQNRYGASRFLEYPKGELLPRIC